MAKTCKEGKAIIPGVVDEYRKKTTDMDIVEIQRLKGMGLKSHEVAEQIHLHLSEVNKHWVDEVENNGIE